MGYIVVCIASFALGFVTHMLFSISSIEELTEENNALYKETWSGKKAEERALEFARKLKAVEDILIDSDVNKEHYFITVEKLKKELFQTGNQGK